MKEISIILLGGIFVITFINTLKLNKIMSRQDQLDQSIANLNDATNEIASDLQKLRDEINAGTVSDQSLAQLDASIETLKKLGQDPESTTTTEATTEETTEATTEATTESTDSTTESTETTEAV